MAVVISGDTGITSVNGTATAPSITGADTNTGIVYGTDTLSLATGGVAAVTVDSSQNVGIGTSSPVYKFEVYDAASAISSVSGDGSVFNILARASSDASGPQFSNQKFRGTIASPTVVESGDITGRWVCFGYDGTTLRPTSEIRSVVDGTPGDTDMPGRLVFYTTPDGSGTSTERMRIDSSGIITGTAGNLMLISGSAVSPASGTSLDFPAIPSWVKRITISLSGVSFAAAGVASIRLGVSNTLVITGYVTTRTGFATTPAIANVSSTDGIATLNTTSAGGSMTGQIVVTNLTGNQWVASGQIFRPTDNVYMTTVGSITLAGTLTNLSFVATTSTFDAGSINIMYE